MTDWANRQHLLVCEARYWLRRGITTPEKVAELRESLKRRGGKRRRAVDSGNASTVAGTDRVDRW